MLRYLIDTVFKNLLDKRVSLESDAPFDPFDAHLSCSVDQRIHPLNSPQSTLPEGAHFEGRLSSPTPVTINGYFSGTLCANCLTTGHKSQIEADLDLHRATISGRVIGNLTIRDHLVLNSTARIQGDVIVGSLTLKEGAIVTGRIHINDAPAEQDKRIS